MHSRIYANCIRACSYILKIYCWYLKRLFVAITAYKAQKVKLLLIDIIVFGYNFFKHNNGRLFNIDMTSSASYGDKPKVSVIFFMFYPLVFSGKVKSALPR